jgi:hypothetical protein
VVQVQLNANAASVHSDRGNGGNGHLTLKITPVGYALRSINHVTFTPPTNPPAGPAHADDTTSAQISEDNSDHAHKWHEFNHYHNVDKILRNQLIVTVPVIYIAALCYPTIAFGSTTTMELLTHIHDMYGGKTEAVPDRDTVTMNAQLQQLRYCTCRSKSDHIVVALTGDAPKSEPAIP